jgi:hypothetical protein
MSGDGEAIEETKEPAKGHAEEPPQAPLASHEHEEPHETAAPPHEDAPAKDEAPPHEEVAPLADAAAPAAELPHDDAPPHDAPSKEPAPADAQEPSADAKAPEPEPAPEPPKPVPPAITSVVPDHGPMAGGAAIVIQGEGFAEGCKVLIGGAEASTTRESATRLKADTPARDQKGFAEVRVVNPDTAFAVYEEDYRYDPAPSITGAAPSCVPTQGGVIVTILGAEFVEGCAVRLGDEVVASSWMNAGRLEAVTKAHAVGEVDLVVENPDGQRAVHARALRFAVHPSLDALEPAVVPTSGGVEVTLRGRGFEQGIMVLVACERVASVTVVSETELRFTAPAHSTAEACDVAVVNADSLADRLVLALSYTKLPPRVTSVTPDSGPNTGGTELVIRGQDFDDGASVFVCGIAATVSFHSAEELRVVTPAVARDGLVDVRVVNRDDQAATIDAAFRYLAPLPPPELAQIGPARGSQIGGLEVRLLGENFAEGATVCFGGVAAAAVRFLTHKEMAATTPAYNGYGEVAVEVKNRDGASSTLENAFTSESRPAPEIACVAPAFGPTTGGTRVVIEGKNFTREATVHIGREHPKDFAFKSATELHVVTAARKQAGVVDVEVSVPGAPRAVMKNAFRYDAVPAPVITSVSPNAGTPAGGTEMTISGKNFSKETIVLVDGKAPKTVKLVDASTLELKTPPGDAGKMVDVIVRNPDGKEAVQKRAFLYDPRYRG